jgi:hypothetical protein
MTRWVQWCIPHLNKPSLRKRVRERMRELLKHIEPIEKPIVRGGPTPFSVGRYTITDSGTIGRVVHIGQEALTVRVWEQDQEGYLTPTHKHSAHVFNRVQHLLVSTLRSGKKLVVGSAEGAPPQLNH